MRKIQRVIAIAVLAVLLISTAAFATRAWFSLFSSTYKAPANSALATAKCQTCHTKGVALNPYGADLKGKPITAASLKSIEGKDSDKDGFTNIQEIKAGTLPGDPASHPVKKILPPAKPVKK